MTEAMDEPTKEQIERAIRDAGVGWSVADLMRTDEHIARYSILAHAETLAASEAREAEQAATIARLRGALEQIRDCTSEHGGAAKALRIINTALEDQHG